MNIFKKIYTILVLIKNVIFRKRHYTLRFVAEYDGVVKRWYYDFKHWGFSHDNLEMVSGADKLCDYYSDNSDEVIVDVIATNKVDAKAASEYDFYECVKLDEKYNFIDKLLYGREYQNVRANEEGKLVITTIWICPVTLFVLGRYPDILYIRKHVCSTESKS